MAGRVRLEIDGQIATIINDHPEKHNAFNDDMDTELFQILGEVRCHPDLRAVVWRGEGKSFSSGRHVGLIATSTIGGTHQELIRRAQHGIQQLWDLDVPVIVAWKGWVMGVSLQRSLLCDIRVAAEGTRLRLPETTHGVIPDNGGVSALFQICGAGLVSDMVLTGRVVSAEEALTHGIVSRVVAEAELETTVYDMAGQIAQAPRFTIMMARDTIRNLSVPVRRASMINELANQTLTTQSDDYAEFRAARAEGRQPCFTGR